MNIPLLREVQAHILAHPEELDMRTWTGACGTTACICGHAALLSGKSPSDIEGLEDVNLSDTRRSTLAYAFGHLGARALDIDINSRLFHHDEWPADLFEAYVQGDARGKAQAAAEAIDLYIEHNTGFGG